MHVSSLASSLFSRSLASFCPLLPKPDPCPRRLQLLNLFDGAQGAGSTPLNPKPRWKIQGAPAVTSLLHTQPQNGASGRGGARRPEAGGPGEGEVSGDEQEPGFLHRGRRRLRRQGRVERRKNEGACEAKVTVHVPAATVARPMSSGAPRAPGFPGTRSPQGPSSAAGAVWARLLGSRLGPGRLRSWSRPPAATRATPVRLGVGLTDRICPWLQ